MPAMMLVATTCGDDNPRSDDTGEPRLCEVLAESFPPQCGGARIPLAEAKLDPNDLQVEGSVTWGNGYVVVLGETIDGALHPAATSI